MTSERAQFSDSSIVDLGALVERVGGDMDLLWDIVQIFFDRYPEAIAKVRAGIVLRDPRSLESAAHSLRGYLVNFHAKRASEAALELEIKGRSGEIAGAGEVLEKLEREIDLVLPLLASLDRKQAAIVAEG